MRQWGLTSEKAEYGRALHCYAITYGPLQGGREEAGGTGGYVVVGTGGHLSDGFKGDGGDGGGGV